MAGKLALDLDIGAASGKGYQLLSVPSEVFDLTYDLGTAHLFGNFLGSKDQMIAGALQHTNLLTSCILLWVAWSYSTSKMCTAGRL